MNSSRKKFQLFIACLVFVAVMACSSFSPKAISSDGPVGSILFASDESGNFEIYHLYIGSSEPIRLTNNTSDDVSPFYIPTSLRVGYLSDKNGKYQIYTSSLTGADEMEWIENDSRTFYTPIISPDESQMAYVIQSENGGTDLFLASADGSNERALTKGSSQAWDPSWSPDGKQIVYTSDADGDWEIYKITVADGKTIRLTNNGSYDGHPRWSPDGNWILFDTDREGDWEIYVMESYGQDQRALTENSTTDWMPAWSPDGQWIVYVSTRDGDDEIYMVDMEGRNQAKLTDNNAQDQYPTWIP